LDEAQESADGMFGKDFKNLDDMQVKLGIKDKKKKDGDKSPASTSQTPSPKAQDGKPKPKVKPVPKPKEWVPSPKDLRPIDSWRQWAEQLRDAFDAPLSSLMSDSPAMQVYHTKKPNPTESEKERMDEWSKAEKDEHCKWRLET